MEDQPKIRSIHFLTPEQLKKKRDGDRLAQRQRRERTKALIQTLQQQVEELQERNRALEGRLCSKFISSRQPCGKQNGPVSGPVPVSHVECQGDKARDGEQGLPRTDVVMDNLSAESLPISAPYSTARDSEAPGNEMWHMLCENPPGLGM